MLKVNIKIVGALQKTLGKDEFEYECRDGITYGDLLLELKYREMHLRHIMVAVGGERKNHDDAVRDGDSILLSTSIGGG